MGKTVAVIAAAASAVIVVAVVLAGGISGQVAYQTSADRTASGDPCVTTAGATLDNNTTSLPPSAQANAVTVVSVADAAGVGDPGAVIAVMVAYTESSLNPAAVNGDHIGLFQQNPGWGTTPERLNPATATAAFLTHLQAIPGWADLPPWVAAQAVQRSQFTGVPSPADGYSNQVGGNYQTNYPLAVALVAAVDRQATLAGCGTQTDPTPAIPDGAIPAGYQIPPNATPAETVAVTYALSKVGGPYVWGGNGPVGYDCSGLVTAAWAAAGITIPRSTQTEIDTGSPATAQTISPGDLVLVPGSDGTISSPGHVAMYIGYGLVVAAADTQDGIIVQTYDSVVAGGLSAIRHVA